MKYKQGNQKKKLVNTEIVRVRDNRKRDLFLIFLFIFTIGALIFFYVWQRLENVELAYRIDNTKKELKKAKELNDSLRLQYEKIISLDQVSKIAGEKLGMREAYGKEIVVTKPVRINIRSSEKTNLYALSRFKNIDSEEN
jgi:hypothetical protein